MKGDDVRVRPVLVVLGLGALDLPQILEANLRVRAVAAVRVRPSLEGIGHDLFQRVSRDVDLRRAVAI